MQRGRPGVLLVSVVALFAASCSGEVEEPVGSSAVSSASTTQAPVSSATAEADVATASPGVHDGPLAEVCGDTIVVQTSSFPDVGAGPLYALLGPEPAVDPGDQTVSAPLTRPDGTVENVTLEIRSGGPAVGFRSPVVLMADDESIDLVLASTAVAVRDRSVFATTAVASLTERSRDAVIVDPQTYPDVADLAALDAADIEIRHITDAPMVRFLVETGVLAPDQLVGGSDGLPASFVEAGGAVAQQGDLTIEPVLLPSLEQWGRSATALPAFDAGWLSLDDLLLADIEASRVTDACLGRLVRVIQQSIVAYVADPAATNVVMSAVRSQFNPLARLTPSLLDLGTVLAIESGVFVTTGDDVPGAIATDGLDAFLTDLAAALDVEAVTAAELIDDRFIDQTISR